MKAIRLTASFLILLLPSDIGSLISDDTTSMRRRSAVLLPEQLPSSAMLKETLPRRHPLAAVHRRSQMAALDTRDKRPEDRTAAARQQRRRLRLKRLEVLLTDERAAKLESLLASGYAPDRQAILAKGLDEAFERHTQLVKKSRVK